MSRAPRRLAPTFALAVATVAALAGCGDSGGPRTPQVVTQTTVVDATAPGITGQGAAPAPTPASVAPSPATPARPKTSTVALGLPRCGGTDGNEIVVNRGSMSCDDVKALLDEYYAMARSGRYGNAGIATVRGFSCSSPTAVTAYTDGFGTGCSTSDTEILVRPTTPAVEGIQESVQGFRQVLAMGDVTWAVTPSQGTFCGISASYPSGWVSCNSIPPTGLAPVTTNPDSGPQAPNSAKMGNHGEPTRRYSSDLPVQGGAVRMKVLDVGHSLASAGISCTTTAADTMTCVNSDGKRMTTGPGRLDVS